MLYFVMVYYTFPPLLLILSLPLLLPSPSLHNPIPLSLPPSPFLSQAYFGGEDIESAIVPDVVKGAEGQQQYGFGGPTQPPQGGGFSFN